MMEDMAADRHGGSRGKTHGFLLHIGRFTTSLRQAIRNYELKDFA